MTLPTTGPASRLFASTALAAALLSASAFTPAWAQSDGATVVVVPATDGGPLETDAGTAQALADDDAPTDADADAPAPEVATGASAQREGTRACVDILADLEGNFTARQREAQDALLTMAAADPLVLRMADGSAVDLRPSDAEAGPTENWFGDPPRRNEVSAAIDSMRAFRDAGSEEECLAAANAITASLNEWEGIEPVGAQDASGAMTTGDAATGAGDTQVVSADPATRTGDAAEAVTDGTSVTAADGDTVLLSEDEAAEVTATADDTGEGDDYGAPAATEQAEVTGENTEGVQTAVETDPLMGTTGDAGEAASETAALSGDLDDRTQEGPGAETPLAPLTTSDEQNDAGVVGQATIPVGSETLDGDVAQAAATPTRMVERPGRIVIEDAEGREVDPARVGVQFRTVPIE